VTRRYLRVALVLVCVLNSRSWAYADLFHANNFLIGDRAVGLGGAFCAVADDASAIVYNPAGMAFAQSSKFIGSGTAFYNRRTVYRKTIGKDDFVESSSGSVPSFFGLLQQIPGLGKGAALGVAFYSPDAESKSQNDLIRKDDLGIRSFHRTVNAQSATNYFGVGLATRLGGSFAVGLAANYVTINELTQEYQGVTRTTDVEGLVLAEAARDRGTLYTDVTQNRKLVLDATAVEPMIGFQWTPLPEIAVGVSYRQPFLVSQKLVQDLDVAVNNRFANDTPFTSADIDDASTQKWRDLKGRGVKSLRQNPEFASTGLPLGSVTVDEPLGGLPAEARFGVAWFASSRLLVSGDVSYRLAPDEGDLPEISIQDTINYHLGLEVYLTSSLPLRLGLFTNNDFRAKPQSGRANQEEHIDYLGGSAVLVWAAGTVQLGLGGVVQKGSGQAQKVADDKAIQEVDSMFYSLVVSAATAM
jgi:hypothetical protein